MACLNSQFLNMVCEFFCRLRVFSHCCTTKSWIMTWKFKNSIILHKLKNIHTVTYVQIYINSQQQHQKQVDDNVVGIFLSEVWHQGNSPSTSTECERQASMLWTDFTSPHPALVLLEHDLWSKILIWDDLVETGLWQKCGQKQSLILCCLSPMCPFPFAAPAH